MQNPTTHMTDMSELLGLTGLEGTERDDMLERIGSLVIESVFLRVVAGMSDEDSLAFSRFTATGPAPESMYEYLADKVPELEEIWIEEVDAFREECVRVLTRQGTMVS